MLRTSFRRSPRSRLLRASFLIFLVVFLLDLLSIASARRRHQGSTIPTNLRLQEEKIFVSSIHWNNEAILRDSWNGAVLDLVNHFGADKIYVSIFESGSWDHTKDALRLLDNELQNLGVPHSIILEENTHADELARTPGPTGWIETPRGKKELRRVPYLSALRNISLKPLAELAKKGIRFQKVLFLNDVVFSTEDVVKLLATRGGDFAAVCSLDFMRPPSFYDTFALRDSNGVEPVTSTFPYFRSSSSRNAMVSGNPVPVQSCWNGIVAFNAEPFYNTDPLQFRGIQDSLARFHLEGSECCLIHADNPLSTSRGVWLNPDVRVGYTRRAYEAVHAQPNWPSVVDSICGIWNNRLLRWGTSFAFKEWRVRNRLRRWKIQHPKLHDEPGVQCLINEMQVLVKNGWAHV